MSAVQWKREVVIKKRVVYIFKQSSHAERELAVMRSDRVLITYRCEFLVSTYFEMRTLQKHLSKSAVKFCQLKT